MLTSYFFLILLLLETIYVRKSQVICASTLNGRYSKSIENYKLTVPYKLSPEGEFVSFALPEFFSHDANQKRKKRSLEDPDLVHYGVSIGGKDYHIELWPNHDFVSPNVLFEDRDPTLRVQDRKLRSLGDKKLCHYTGRIRGYPNSRAAISTCDGLAGYIMLNNVRYFIEPVDEHQANEKGHHLHLVYEPRADMKKYEAPRCGTSDNWEEAWKERFRTKLLRGDKVTRGTASEHRYLEVMVVADKKFLEHHKVRDVETYIMTIMNMVSDFYHDATAGHMMDVVIVRMMYLHKEEEEIDLVINQNSDATLESFCKWQVKINPPDDNPLHHDIAVLLTRYDLCSSDGSEAACGLMGLAYVGTACEAEKHCAINEDGGMNLMIVLTHEMGHVMGCSHDSTDTPCSAQDPSDDAYYVMAPYVHMYTTRWSTCSRGFLTALFENGLGDCLNDEPEPSVYKLKHMLAGVVYDAEAQCQFNSPGATSCKASQKDFCEMLLCKPDPSSSSCSGLGEPPADGTKCGENMWCFHSKCVEIGQRPEAIDGGWGEWGEFSQCSRSCGGGVSTATRDCNNPVPEHLGKYCLGERKKYKICNTSPCPPGSTPFYEEQCASHNGKPVDGEIHTWKKYNVPGEPCVLYCIHENNVYTKVETKVIDGTPCKSGTKDMCVDGACKAIGCDFQFDSQAVEDICGICNGDGTQCKIIEEVYRDTGGHDYKKVVTIPAGSRNVHIDELGSSPNTIAVSDKTEQKYYLNGNHVEEKDGENTFGGDVTGLYSHPEPGKESLFIKGPLTEDINFFIVFYRPDENVGYSYKYAEPSTDTSYTPQYQWELLEWSECTKKCGGGDQTAKYDCVEAKAGKVSDNFCMGMEKPEAGTKKCNEEPCKTKWKVGKWSKCHACKNRSGVRMREVVCVQESSTQGAEDELIEDDKCQEAKPATKELCESPTKCKTRDANSKEDDDFDRIPSAFLDDVHAQIKVREPRDQEQDLDKLVDQLNTKGAIITNQSCSDKNQTRNMTKMELKHLGEVVRDWIPPEEIKVIRVPMKLCHTSICSNLSDKAFQSMGDTVADKLDTSHAEIVTGKKAAQVLKDQAHRFENGTSATQEEPENTTRKATKKKPKKGHKEGKRSH